MDTVIAQSDTLAADRQGLTRKVVRVSPPTETNAAAGRVGDAPAPEGAPGVSLREFLTDGSIARMCDELSRLTGVPVWLRDIDGQVIVPGEGDARWGLVDAPAGIRRAYAIVGKEPREERVEVFAAPLRSSAGVLGSIAMPADWGQDDPLARRSLERAVTILASTAVEYVEGALTLRERIDALDALFRLSSLLVKADDPDKLVQAALDLALDVLRMDAGTVSVIDDSAGTTGASALRAAAGSPGAVVELQHRAVRNLSTAWLKESSPLSIDGQLRAAALRGEVVVVRDVRSDARIADASRATAEGIASLISTGLIFGGRSLGLLRLYSRQAREFTASERNLMRSIADHAAMALAHARLRQLRQQDDQMRRQVRLAADVQQRMLPRTLPSFERFDLAARYAPSFSLGGDFYDLFESQGKLAVAVGDVVGKGVPAALIMSAVRASLRAYAGEDLALSEVIARVNRAAVRDTMESEFITMWAAMVCPQTLTVTYTAAGHDPAVLFACRDGRMAAETRELSTYDMALGLDPAQPYGVGREKLNPGDVLVAYTDGLTDAADFEGRRFTRARAIETIAAKLRDDPGISASNLIEHVMWTLRQFAGVRMNTDDITLVVMRVR
jgi:sigma-B regulation protein RsbU (phosphoserine phosphatase)